MSSSIHFKDEQGNVLDEDGNDSMAITQNEDPSKLDELTSYSAYIAVRDKFMMEVDQDPNRLEQTMTQKQKKNSPEKQKNNLIKNKRVNNEFKAPAVHLVDVHPKNSTRAVALDLGLEPKSVQRWYSNWKKDPDFLFKTIGRPRIIEAEGDLAVATKNTVTEFYYKQPTVTANQLLDRLISTVEALSLSKPTLYHYLNDL